MPDTPTRGSTAAPPATDYDVDEEARHCPHCGRPFRTDHLLTLHLGETHTGKLSDAEVRAYEAARDEEDDQLFVFHLKVLAIITLVTFVFIYTYTFVWL